MSKFEWYDSFAIEKCAIEHNETSRANRYTYLKSLKEKFIKFNFSDKISIFLKPFNKLLSIYGFIKNVLTKSINGIYLVLRDSFTMIGVTIILFATVLVTYPDLIKIGEEQLFSFLQTRQVEVKGFSVDPIASKRATATNPTALTKSQSLIAYWLSKKYDVAVEPLSALVAEAYVVGNQNNIDPTLLLSIMAVESSFNPFAQSSVGAQGLMQVMTKVHGEKYVNFGGNLAAFDPITNLKVGTKVLRDCIHASGSVNGGLKRYVGAYYLKDDNGYVNKVLSIQSKLKQVSGEKIKINHQLLAMN